MEQNKLTLLVGVGSFLLGGAVGRYTLPKRVETIDKSTHTVKELQAINHYYQVDINELAKKLEVILKKNNVTTEKAKTTVTRPDGTVEVSESEKTVDLSETNTKIDTQTSTLTTIQSQLSLLTEKLELDETTKTKIVTNGTPAGLKVGVLLGYDFASIWGRGHDFNILPVSGLVGQLQVEKRLLGPVYGTLWFQSTGVAGLGISGAF